MKKLIRSARAHSIPPFYLATTFTVSLDLDMVPGAMHTIENAAEVILHDCNYLLAAMVDTSVKPGSKGVQIQILGAMDSVWGAFHNPKDHVGYIKTGSCRSYIKDVIYDPDFEYAFALRRKYNEMCDEGDFFLLEEIAA